MADEKLIEEAAKAIWLVSGGTEEAWAQTHRRTVRDQYLRAAGAVLEMGGHEVLRRSAQRFVDAIGVSRCLVFTHDELAKLNAMREALAPSEPPPESRGFYEELYRREQTQRIERICKDRPENLHDYQGCVAEAALTPAAPETPTEPKSFAEMPIRVDPSMPKDEIRFEHPDGRVDRIVGIGEPADGHLVDILTSGNRVAMMGHEFNSHIHEAFKRGQQVCLSSRNLYTPEQIEKAVRDELCEVAKFGPTAAEVCAKAILARLHPEPAKQERVTVTANKCGCCFIVKLDGVTVKAFTGGTTSEVDAERYANGLRQEIAEKGKAE